MSHSKDNKPQNKPGAHPHAHTNEVDKAAAHIATDSAFKAADSQLKWEERHTGKSDNNDKGSLPPR